MRATVPAAQTQARTAAFRFFRGRRHRRYLQNHANGDAGGKFSIHERPLRSLIDDVRADTRCSRPAHSALGRPAEDGEPRNPQRDRFRTGFACVPDIRIQLSNSPAQTRGFRRQAINYISYEKAIALLSSGKAPSPGFSPKLSHSSAPIPKFVTHGGTLESNFGIERALASL